MSVIVNCIVCGKAFEAKKRSKQYCSAMCYKDYNKHLQNARSRLAREKKRREELGLSGGKTLAEWDAEARALGRTYGEHIAILMMEQQRAERKRAVNE